MVVAMAVIFRTQMLAPTWVGVEILLLMAEMVERSALTNEGAWELVGPIHAIELYSS